MTSAQLESEFLTLRYFLRRVVVPAVIVTATALIVMTLMTRTEFAVKHQGLIIGFFGLYFVLVRGGHIVMIRSLHKDLISKYERPYKERLSQLTVSALKKRNLGFVLARIKRDILIEVAHKRDRLTHPERYRPKSG